MDCPKHFYGDDVDGDRRFFMTKWGTILSVRLLIFVANWFNEVRRTVWRAHDDMLCTAKRGVSTFLFSNSTTSV
jgi:hypothetical protein